MMTFTTITEKIDNTPTVSTLKFRWDKQVEPGQFVMIWIPGVGEIPMSLSSTGEEKAVTVKEYGETSRALRTLGKGDRLFLRGPYGNTFTETTGRILLVGGGSGMASLRPLISEKADGVVSARSADELLFPGEFRGGRVFRVTDDGSAGIKGTPVDQLEGMDLSPYSRIYVCGPEKMLKAVMDHLLKRQVSAEFSLERIMKCGIGVCDSCSIDGYQLCRDGPVFSMEQLSGMREFGREKLTVSGKRVTV